MDLGCTIYEASLGQYIFYKNAIAQQLSIYLLISFKLYTN